MSQITEKDKKLSPDTFEGIFYHIFSKRKKWVEKFEGGIQIMGKELIGWNFEKMIRIFVF